MMIPALIYFKIYLQYLVTIIWYSTYFYVPRLICKSILAKLNFKFGIYSNAQVTSQFLSQIFSSAAKIPIHIKHVEFEKIGVGVSQAAFRAKITYFDTPFVTSVIIKHYDYTAAASARFGAMLQGHAERECQFYRMIVKYSKDVICTHNDKEYALDVPTIYHEDSTII